MYAYVDAHSYKKNLLSNPFVKIDAAGNWSCKEIFLGIWKGQPSLDKIETQKSAINTMKRRKRDNPRKSELETKRYTEWSQT